MQNVGARWPISHFAILLIVLLVTSCGFLPTPTPTPEPTAAPADATPTPAPPPPTAVPPPAPAPQPRMFDFIACRPACNGTNQSRVFPERSKEIWLQWKYENIPTGADYMRLWTLDGREWVRYTCKWPGPATGVESLTLSEPQGLHSGDWVV